MKHSRSSLPAHPAWAVFPELEPATAAAPQLRRSRWKPFSEPEREFHGELAGSVKATSMAFTNMHDYGDLLVKYLRARREIFIDRLHWHLSEAEGMEFDQYDNPFCRWVVLHEYGQVLGGVRLVPTTASCGVYSYMLRDAQHGILEDIPTDVLFFKAPVDPMVWEASRFFITDAVPAMRRGAIQRLLFTSMSRAAHEEGASYLLGIVPSIWSRWARRLGAGATPVGAKFSIDGTWSQSVLFRIADFIPEAGRPAA